MRDGLVCHAYCLMGNHYHLLVETPLANLGEAMHRINRGYVQQFNATHEREGHLFERRYRSWIMGDEARQMEALRYIVRIPSARDCALHRRSGPGPAMEPRLGCEDVRPS